MRALRLSAIALIVGMLTLARAVIGTAQPSTPSPTSATFYRAVNINGPAQLIGGNNWENGTGTVPNFTTTVGAFRLCNTWSPLTPPTGEYATMVRCAMQHWSHQITMSAVPNGLYDLSIYVFQDYNNAAAGAARLSVQGAVVNASYPIPTQAGAWQKLTFRTSVTAGTLQFSTDGDVINVSGFEVWQIAADAPTATFTASLTHTATFTRTVTLTHTITPTSTITRTNTPPTFTPSPTTSRTSTRTPVPEATDPNAGSPTPQSTVTPSSSVTPSPTLTPSLTPSQSPSASPSVTASPTASPTATSTPQATGRTFYRAVNLNGPAQVIEGNQWEAGTGTVPDFTITAGAFAQCNTWSPLSPPAGEYGTMVRCAVQHWRHQIRMTNVTNGLYELSVYVFQDYNNAGAGATSLSVQGIVVNANYPIPTQAGAWQKLTFQTVVAGNTLRFNTDGSNINLSGFEVWRLPSPTPTLTRTPSVTVTRSPTPNGEEFAPPFVP